MRETFIWIGDGIKPLEPGEMIGKPVNIGGRTVKVIENSALTITVQWDWTPVSIACGLWGWLHKKVRF